MSDKTTKTPMQIGMVGLGRMGANMVRRLIKGGHQCVVFNRTPQKVNDLVKESAVGASSLADLVEKLQKPRVVWLMVPAAVVDNFIADLLPLLEPDDILIDGGNSYYVDVSMRWNGGGISRCPSYEIVFCYRGARNTITRYEITVENPRRVSRGVVGAELDGVEIAQGAARIPLVDDGQINRVRVERG